MNTFISFQFFGGRGSAGAGGGGGAAKNSGTKYLSSEARAKVVDDVEKAVNNMKAPTLSKSSVVESHGITGIVSKERNMAKGGGTFFDITIWDGDNKVYNVARSNWAQSKDVLFNRMPSIATAKAEGHSY